MQYPIIYIYKRTSDKGRELRYSLRSLENIQNWNGEVFLIGDKEDWFMNVTVIPADKYPTRSADVQSKYMTIATHKQIPQDFILVNDDMYILKPVTIKPLHQGKLSEIEATGVWSDTKRRTGKYLEDMGIKNPKDYDIHVPMVMNKEKLLEVLKHHNGRNEKNHLMTRTLYGNIHKIGGVYRRDPKVSKDSEFMSGTVYTESIGKLFTKRSRFEEDI